VIFQDVNNQKPFVSVTCIDQQGVNRSTMPQSLRLIYEQAKQAPAFHLLNPYWFAKKTFGEKIRFLLFVEMMTVI
jgi:hypothetical protein